MELAGPLGAAPGDGDKPRGGSWAFARPTPQLIRGALRPTGYARDGRDRDVLNPKQLLIGAVLAELVFDISGFGVVIWRGDRVAILGGVVRTVLMGTLGYYAILKDARWARLTFAGIEYFTALGGFWFAFFSWTAKFEPVAFAIFIGFLAVALAATFPEGGGWRARMGR